MRDGRAAADQPFLFALFDGPLPERNEIVAARLVGQLPVKRIDAQGHFSKACPNEHFIDLFGLALDLTAVVFVYRVASLAGLDGTGGRIELVSRSVQVQRYRRLFSINDNLVKERGRAIRPDALGVHTQLVGVLHVEAALKRGPILAVLKGC